jgi:type I restriction enzyme, S subunit
MKMSTVNFADFVRHRKEFIRIDDFTQYTRARVQLHWRGIVERDRLEGAVIKTKSQQVARTGELLVAEIDAKVGGVGIVPPELEGAVVSSHYFLFEIDESKCLRKWLDYFVRSGALEDQVAARGSTNYAAIRPHHVLGFEIPLPPLSEQRRIVARIEELSAKIEEARGMRQHAASAVRAVLQAARRKLIGEMPQRGWIPLRTYVQEIENGWSPACESRPAQGEEWGVLKVGAVSFGEFDPTENKALPVGLEANTRYEVRAGDFLMSRANTLELAGACALVQKTPSRLMLSDKIFRFVFKNGSGINLGYLNHVLKSPALRLQIEQGATGTSPTMKNISKEKTMRLLIPQLALAEQRRIVAYLDDLQSKVDAVKKLQEESEKELNALMPSILSKAFAGEL